MRKILKLTQEIEDDKIVQTDTKMEVDTIVQTEIIEVLHSYFYCHKK